MRAEDKRLSIEDQGLIFFLSTYDLNWKDGESLIMNLLWKVIL
jgi:hypothetical protein